MPHFMSKVRHGVIAICYAAAFLIVFALLNNSGLWPARSAPIFTEQFDRAFLLGTTWMIEHPEEENTALLYMIADMAEMSGDARLQKIVDRFMGNQFIPRDYIWRRVVDIRWPTVRSPSREELDSYEGYQRWIVYGVAPDQVWLTEQEHRDMFSPDKFWWGKRTHQLYALLFYRKQNLETQAVDQLITHLSERIANEANWDFRVTDLSIQRAAFILAAGKPDLIKRRWVERILDNQHPDGGWLSSWYGLGPNAFAVSFRSKSSNSHTTVQAAWVLYMLKYRYPDWLKNNYPDGHL
jgi:hypothetical protein